MFSEWGPALLGSAVTALGFIMGLVIRALVARAKQEERSLADRERRAAHGGNGKGFISKPKFEAICAERRKPCHDAMIKIDKRLEHGDTRFEELSSKLLTGIGKLELQIKSTVFPVAERVTVLERLREEERNRQ